MKKSQSTIIDPMDEGIHNNKTTDEFITLVKSLKKAVERC